VNIVVRPSKRELGRVAAAAGADAVRASIREHGRASIILATGASQFEMLAELVKAPGIDWGQVDIFHLDEYIGFPAEHPASFRRYLQERFISKLSAPPHVFQAIDGENDPVAECLRVGQIIAAHEIDVAFIGIGENGHLAFNDPPADFDTEEPFIVVDLDDACRRQQLGEGWFATIDDVPARAISMSIRQIMKSRTIICTVPDARKARAVKAAVEGPVTPNLPASILQEHAAATIFLDRESAALLS